MTDNKKIPAKTLTDKTEKELVRICVSLRYKYKNNKLTAEQITTLEAFPFWFWSKNIVTISVDEKITNISKWVNKRKKLPSTASSDEYEKYLGNACKRLRKLYAKNKLSTEQIKNIKAIPKWHL